MSATRVRGRFQTLAPLLQTSPGDGRGRERGTTVRTRTWRVPPVEAGGEPAQVPVISGNSFRGRSRRALAQHLCETLQVTPQTLDPQVTHLLFIGGAIARGTKNTLTPEAKAEMRRLLPGLSLFGGSALGAMFDGRAAFGDWVAQVRETPEPCLLPGVSREDLPAVQGVMDTQRWVQAAGLLEEVYGRDRIEQLSADLRAALKLADQSVAEGEGGIRESLPYGAEVVAAGVTFGGWVAVDAQANDIERAALRRAFDLAFPADADGVREVFLGGGANRGLGLVRLEIDLSPVAPDTAAYDTYLQAHGDEIRRYLSSGKLVPVFQAAP